MSIELEQIITQIKSEVKNYSDFRVLLAEIKKSQKLLQHFRSFSLSYFEQNILKKSFLSELNNITSNYRNKAADPNILNLRVAKECQVLLRKNLNLFLEAKIIK